MIKVERRPFMLAKVTDKGIEFGPGEYASTGEALESITDAGKYLVLPVVICSLKKNRNGKQLEESDDQGESNPS